MDRLVDEEELTGGAALAGAEERGGEGRFDGGVQVRVLQQDHGPVSAHLEELRLSGGALGDSVPGLDRPDEPHGMRAGAARDLVADLGPGPGDEVEDTCRKLCVDDALGQLTAQIEVVGAGTQTTALPDASAGAITSAGIV